jgi:hypothetical protein
MTLGQALQSARWLGAMAILCGICAPAHASTVSLGALSYDTFIPPSTGSPGVDAFNVANLTGSFSLPADFPVIDDLTFQGTMLFLNPVGLAQEVFSLGDIGPGFLQDSGGNPVVQVPSTLVFTSAELKATLSAAMFTLADGTSFAPASTSIDVLLLPSSGSSLTADVDQITLDVSSAPVSTTPEPASGCLTLLVLPWLLRRRRTR